MKKKKIAIIGSGMIGMSLAALFTGNGYETTVYALNEDFIRQGIKNYESIYDTLEARKLLTGDERVSAQNLLHFALTYEEIADVQIVFECAIEKIEVKFEVYRSIETYCNQVEAIVSTTSALSADDLAKGLTIYKPVMMVAHPFNPPHLVPFVEMVRNEDTNEEATQLVYNILEGTGRKVVIMKKGAPGFIANRLQHALLREAFNIVEEGYADARDVDKALMYSFMPRYTSVGLFEHQDAAGLDMVASIENYLFPDLSNRDSAPDLVMNNVKAGNLGQKTGKGIYEWTEESRKDFSKRAMEPYWKYFNWEKQAEEAGK